LIAEVEETLNLSIENEEAERIKSVGEAIDAFYRLELEQK
jgi:acyl carrier protein